VEIWDIEVWEVAVWKVAEDVMAYIIITTTMGEMETYLAMAEKAAFD